MNDYLNVLKNPTIKTKLNLMIVSISILTIVLVFSGFFTYERVTYRKLMINDIGTKTAIIAENCNAALAFRDSMDASRILHSLASQTHVMAAAIYDSDKKIFATYIRPGEMPLFPDKPEGDNSTFESDALVSFKPIKVNNSPIGTLYMKMDLGAQEARFWSYLEIAAIVFLGAMVITYYIGTGLAKNIAAPIIALSATVQLVNEKQDYSIRASNTTKDETGFLADSFNQLLSHIQERDTNLRRSNDALTAAEQRYRTTLDNMQEGCQIIDFNYRYVYVNEVAAKQGHSTKASLTGAKMADQFPGIEKTGFFASLQQCMTGRMPITMQNEFIYPDGSTGWFDLNLEPVPEGVFILSSDITKERQLTKELETYHEHLEELVQDRTEQLQRANKELESFSYSVSHDLRAPLRHINGFVDLLIKRVGDAADETSRRYMKVIAESSQHMGNLIDDLLVFSRMGRAEMMVSTVNMQSVVNDVIKNFEQEINGRVIHWSIDDLPSVNADGSMIRLVYQNLIGNAIKYTGKNKETDIHIGYELQSGLHVFFVRDNGVGFDMKYADKLFGVFQRLHHNEEFEGTGIGLANVQRIVHRHGGTTWAEAHKGRGAVFYFSLPRREKEESI